jgi:hypothetical protein
MDPFLILIVVIVIGIALTNHSSEEWFFFDLFSGRMADPNYSTNRINDEFNGFFHVLIAAVLIAGACFLFSGIEYQPKRVFIPIDRTQTMASNHSHGGHKSGHQAANQAIHPAGHHPLHQSASSHGHGTQQAAHHSTSSHAAHKHSSD